MRPFLFKSENKTDAGHLKQTREGLSTIFYWPYTLSYAITRKWNVMSGGVRKGSG